MHLLNRFLNFFLPTACSYCRSSVGDSPVPYFCLSCWSDFSPISGPLCPRCGKPFGSPEALSHSPDHECLSCRRHPPRVDQSLSVGEFEGSLREAIHQFKYRPCRSLGGPLAEWMADRVRLTQHPDLVMPVPLHRKRLRQRGFNQSLLLAHGLSERFAIPLSFDNLLRNRFTRPQVELSGEERFRNVSGAFALQRPAEVEGTQVLLIDDVYTTGATLNECAQMLKDAGASSVNALTLARTL
ncbi:MAG: hypothetical protein A2X56_11560 [Nitrospirae bacterium GWC2_57_13]|jgi:ComF family protein|nr:MAG: hypothetical protein A2072_03760 [Nitrospirae bacterium GWC1_57_7]OGW27495.1 MAG: hypothetical protein A2X56_11560 [Nitrospirae bacterium GWC2_57_13]OGW44661.1 MAG: hypothetical protein A2X57_06545 [Nitrospirae bacterium GWD2_57_8]HAS53124.1 amidophosphoribosyltransferase [Nitrospiraceae bacterium]